MSQETPRTKVEFSEESIRRRQFASRLFRGFALATTFLGLALLLIFLGRLTLDVMAWFQEMPKEVLKKNVRIEAELVRLADPARVLRERLAELHQQRDGEIKPDTDDATRNKILADYDQIEQRLRADLQVTSDEQRREAENDFRPDTSPGGLFWHFVTSGPAPEDSPQDAGILYGILGTLALVAITLLFALPIGVGAAIYLEEYRSSSWLARIIQLNINNLSGVPSVMFGILGAFLFVECVFRPIEAEMERPARITEYRQRQEQLTRAGTLKEDPGEDDRLRVEVVNDPTGKLKKIRAEYEKLVAAGKAPAKPADEDDRIRAVLDREGQLKEMVPRYEAYLAEKKIKERVKSDLDIPAAVLKAEGKTTKEIGEKTKWVNEARDVEAMAQRIAVDQRLVSPPNWFVQSIASVFRALGVSLAARNVLGGGLTLALLILPVLIVAAQEAIRAVPQSLRHGALALGATQWQTVRKVVLPSAAPGILTGSILALCRAMGEAAPLVLFGATLYIDQMPSLFSRFTVLPMQIFVWSDRVSEHWRLNAALASAVLLVILLTLNGVAIYLRQRSQRATRY